MSLTKKILCGILVLISVISGAVPSVFAENNFSFYVEEADISKPDRLDYTPLMNAVDKLDVTRVERLLSEGHDLNIPAECELFKMGLRTVFDMISMKATIFSEWIIEFPTVWYSEEELKEKDRIKKIKVEATEKITRAILEHCAKNRIILKVNDDFLYDEDFEFYKGIKGENVKCIVNVWRKYGESLFEDYRKNYPELFNYGYLGYSYKT